jgi:hypothetical protein
LLNHLLVEVVKFGLFAKLFDNLFADLAYAHQVENRTISVLWLYQVLLVLKAHL